MIYLELTRLECRTKPMRDGNQTLLAIYDDFFRSAEIELIPLSTAVVNQATELRAIYNVRIPDALHLAAAIEASATAFLTGDQGLTRCKKIKVEIL